MRGVGIAVLVLVGLLIAAVPANAADSRRQTLRQLDLQYELAGDVPMRNAPWVFTHNSYNSPAEMGVALSPQDRNQNITVVDQLDEGVRSLELDVHLFLGRPVLCHSTGPHLGCSTEKTFRQVLTQIRGWMDRNPRQVLLLYLEGHLDNARRLRPGRRRPRGRDGRPDLPARQPAVRAVTSCRSSSPATRCAPRASGSCSTATAATAAAGTSYVHDDRQRLTASTNAPFRDFPDCGPDYKRARVRLAPGALLRGRHPDRRRHREPGTAGSRRRWWRGWPAAAWTWWASTCWSAATRGWPRRCGAGAPASPSPGRDCAIQGTSGRWFARPCGERHRVACRDATGLWRIAKRATARGAARACGRPGLLQAVPRTGYEGQRLLAAQKRAGAGAVWLGHRRRGNGWKPYERKGCRASTRRCPR